MYRSAALSDRIVVAFMYVRTHCQSGCNAMRSAQRYATMRYYGVKPFTRELPLLLPCQSPLARSVVWALQYSIGAVRLVIGTYITLCAITVHRLDP